MSRFSVCLGGLLGLVVLGCGPGGPKTYPVSGKVTKGGSPLASVSVTFNPADSAMPIGTGQTSSDGTFEVTSGNEGKSGLVPGKYKITLQQIGGGSGMEAGMKMYMKSGGKGSAAPKVESSIPKEYGAVASTPKEVDITAGSNTVNIELP